jgi:hypothetical protein
MGPYCGVPRGMNTLRPELVVVAVAVVFEVEGCIVASCCGWLWCDVCNVGNVGSLPSEYKLGRPVEYIDGFETGNDWENMAGRLEVETADVSDEPVVRDVKPNES